MSCIVLFTTTKQYSSYSLAVTYNSQQNNILVAHTHVVVIVNKTIQLMPQALVSFKKYMPSFIVLLTIITANEYELYCFVDYHNC
jgi:hypothetical protein